MPYFSSQAPTNTDILTQMLIKLNITCIQT